MVMVFWWIVPAMLVLVAIALAAARFRRPPQRGDDVLLANTQYVPKLRSYRRLMVEYRALFAGAAVFLVTALIGGTALAARESASRTYSPELATRDIVLCMDVSESMREYNVQIIDKFLELSKNFTGERMSLTIFNRTATTVFPLTDDYALVQQELQQAKTVLQIDPETATGSAEATYQDFMGGTALESLDGSSLISDGVASCAFQFDNQDKERSRSMVLATDNEVNGDPIFTLTEAMDEVATRDIRLYAMYVPGYWGGTSYRDEYQREVDRIHGLFYKTDDEAMMPAIIDNIQQQDVNLLSAAPQTFHQDQPMIWFIVALVGVAGIILVGWRLDS